MVDATDASAMLKALKDARKALHTIANLSEGGCARYVAKADALALDALIALDIALEDMGLS